MRCNRVHAHCSIADNGKTVSDKPVCMYGYQWIGVALAYKFHFAQSAAAIATCLT